MNYQRCHITHKWLNVVAGKLMKSMNKEYLASFESLRIKILEINSFERENLRKSEKNMRKSGL